MSAAVATMPGANLLSAAVGYAAKGWPVFPLHTISNGVCTCTLGQKCHSPGKHPRTPNGFKDGTFDLATVEQWWTRSPDSNIGLWCRDFIVVDVDPRNGGDVSLDELFSTVADKHGFETLTAITGGGGRHYVFKNPDGGGHDCKPAPGIEIKSAGGLIVIAPSIHLSGHRYEWEDTSIPPAEVPQWLLNLIKKPEKPAIRPAFTGKPLDLEKFIAKHRISVKPPKICRCNFGGYQWDIDGPCPFQQDYFGGSPAIGVTAAGATWFGCFCGDHPRKTWKDFRALYGAVQPRSNSKESGTAPARVPENLPDRHAPPLAPTTATGEPADDPVAPPATGGASEVGSEVPESEYIPNTLLDEEVDEALAKNDPTAIWRLTTLLGTMEFEEYQIHRAVIKTRFGGRVPIAELDKAVAAKRNSAGTPGAVKDDKLPPNEVGKEILGNYDVINVMDNIYVYDGRKWVPSAKSYIEQLALREDGEWVSTRHRRTEIASFIATKIYRRDHVWRQIEMYEVPVANGMIDIRTMTVRPHRKEDYLQTCIPWEYSAKAQCPELMRCLDTYFGGDDDGEAKIAALQEFFGYCLMPHARYKKALLCVGESDCGKSTIPFLLRQLVGGENIAAVGVEHMDDERKRAPLLGKLVNLLTELTSDAMIADGGFKTLVSTEEPILFDGKYQAPVMDIPICKHVIVTNSKPRINDKSNATYRRLLLIHFNHVIPLSEQDTTVWDRLRLEVDGILSWALEGAQRLHHTGGRFTDPGTSEIAEYRVEQNPFAQFVAEKCEEGDDYSVFLQEIRTQFEMWNGQKVRPQYLAGLIRSAGFEITNERIYVGTLRGFRVLGVRL